MKIEIIKGDYGYSYKFYLKEPDGSVSNLDGATLKLRAKHSEKDIAVEKEVSVLTAAAGTCLYTLGENDFQTDGVYYGEIEVSKESQLATYQGFTIIVLAKV